MSIERIPKPGPGAAEVTTLPAPPIATPAAKPAVVPAQTPAAMEKPATLATPQPAPTQPAPGATAGRSSPLDQEVERLREALRGRGAGRTAAAHQALALAGSFRLRRSRGARKLGLELCEAAAEAEPELAPLARELSRVLVAEGELFELTAEGTLRACRALVDIIEEGDRS
jgi:hypothetical protein